MYKLIDLTHTIKNDMPIYPGDYQTKLYSPKIFESDGYNYSILEMGMHTGTHIDAPSHLIESGSNISTFPLETFIGMSTVLDVKGETIIKVKKEYHDKVIQSSIVLLHTGFGARFKDSGCKYSAYFDQHPVLDLSFCKFLVEKKIKLLGIDTPSPDNFPFEIHKFLLKNNILIIENLTNLDKLLDVPKFEIIAFPLKINVEGSIARVVANILE